MNMACSATLCKPQGPGDAVLNAGDLQNLLAASSVEVTTRGAHGVQADDIVVAAPLGWASASVLTLDANHNLTIDQPITVMGTAGLSLNYNPKHSDLTFGSAGNVTYWDTASTLTIDNVAYALVSDIATLARKAKKNPLGAYALARSYDASQDGAYRATPIPAFSGTFEGLGNAISNLTIADTQSVAVGLFGRDANGGPLLRDIGLPNASVTGAADNAFIGALVGNTTGAIVGSYSTGSISGSGKDDQAGGLGGSIGVALRSYSAASVSIAGGTGSGAGGLAGSAVYIEGSHATGAVSIASGGYDVGGLAGAVSSDRDYSIVDSYATGSVTTNADGSAGAVGGLAGNCCGIAGGILRSFATGDVREGMGIGGLLGNGSVPIVDSYATGSVTSTTPQAGNFVGGLIGFGDSPMNNPIATSYSIGAVSGNDPEGIGGFDGWVDQNTGPFSRCYWDVETSGQTEGYGHQAGVSVAGIAGLTTQQLQKKLPRGFSSKVWTIDPSGAVNGGFPYLIANPPPQ